MIVQLESWASLLTDNRLQASLGTFKTVLRAILGERWIKPFPAMAEKEPSAIRIFSCPEQGI